jgi:hypothetical protein
MNERLQDWTQHHIEHRDIFLKKLVGFEETDFGFITHFKDKDVEYIISDTLNFDILEKEKEQCFVTVNNSKNFNTMTSEWKILIAYPKLKIIFVEKISTGEHWQISPYMHDKIADKKTLKSGLKSLFDSAKN